MTCRVIGAQSVEPIATVATHPGGAMRIADGGPRAAVVMHLKRMEAVVNGGAQGARPPDRRAPGFLLSTSLAGTARRALILSTALHDDHAPRPSLRPDDAVVRNARALLARLGWQDERCDTPLPYLLSRVEVQALGWAANTAVLKIVPVVASLMASGADLVPSGADSSLLALLDSLNELSAVTHAHLYGGGD